MMGLVPLLKEEETPPSSSLPCKDTVKKQSSVSQEKSSNQELNKQKSLSWISQPPKV